MAGNGEKPKIINIKDRETGKLKANLESSDCTMGIRNNSGFETLSSRRTIKAIRRE